RGRDLALPPPPRRLSPLAQHAGPHHGAGPHRVRLLAADAAPAALHGGPRHLRLRRHAGQVPDVLVVRLRRHEQDLEPVRRHAQPPLRLVAVLRLRAGAPAAAPSPAGGAVVFSAGYGLSRRFTRPGPVLTDPEEPDAADGAGSPAPSGSARFSE